jgi:hypothetical protein
MKSYTCILEHPVADDTLSAEVHIMQWARKATLDIMGIAKLGRNFNSLQNADD